MRLVTGVAFGDDERNEIGRAMRWIGLHPQADLTSTRGSYAKRGDTFRRELAGMLNNLIDDASPLFAERLGWAVTVLSEMLDQAAKEADLSYWTEVCQPPVPEPQALVLVEARRIAMVDIGAALAVVTRAVPLASPARQPEDEDDEDEDETPTLGQMLADPQQ